MVPSSTAGRLTPLVLLLVAATLSAALDCRKFVFAPQCRGIVAKRAGGGAPALRLRGDFSGSDLVPVVSDEDYQNAVLEQDGGEDPATVADTIFRFYAGLLSNMEDLTGPLEEDTVLVRDPAEYITKQQKRSARTRGLRSNANHLASSQQQQHNNRRQVAGQHQLPNPAFLQGILPATRRANARR